MPCIHDVSMLVRCHACEAMRAAGITDEEEQKKETPMRVMVRFKGDNDFGRVLRAFGDLLLQRVREEDPEVNAPRVALWFNALAPHIYMMVQARTQEPAELERISEYLQITSEDVYINEAIDEKMKTYAQWGNYDSVMIDGSEHAREKVYMV